MRGPKGLDPCMQCRMRVFLCDFVAFQPVSIKGCLMVPCSISAYIAQTCNPSVTWDYLACRTGIPRSHLTSVIVTPAALGLPHSLATLSEHPRVLELNWQFWDVQGLPEAITALSGYPRVSEVHRQSWDSSILT